MTVIHKYLVTLSVVKIPFVPLGGVLLAEDTVERNLSAIQKACLDENVSINKMILIWIVGKSVMSEVL